MIYFDSINDGKQITKNLKQNHAGGWIRTSFMMASRTMRSFGSLISLGYGRWELKCPILKQNVAGDQLIIPLTMFFKNKRNHSVNFFSD